ncbi:mannitol dehydrogenase family protein [Gayadomonas joobiniege]|uniref:mannitol dehydrogenase family protein n=1 Tax=Gayadomonas joobiniege TaxID=1234606 RepID=UPI00035EADE3|nr:mannitol dehydrogenase family protein [Gayadomonas joobiniege]
MKLNNKTLQTLKAQGSTLKFPSYDREATKIGIVHLGPGAFHRAHQAVFTHDAMNEYGGDWGICAVSMRSATARDELTPQDGLYGLVVNDIDSDFQVIGSIKKVLVLGDQLDEILDQLKSADTKIVSLTVTEKGYCLNGQGELDLTHPDIVHDIKNPRQPLSAPGLIVAGLNLRKSQNTPAFNVLSCDNLPDNGVKLKGAVIQLAKQNDPDLATWIEQNVIFPCSMVDSITPKTEDSTREYVKTEFGLDDAWPIQREAFTQWIIDDTLPEPKPAWDKVGVIFTPHIDQFEQAKLRILNGTHSTLAYMGLLKGHESVYQAISDKALKAHCLAMLTEEIIPSMPEITELDLSEYANDIIKRFENPNIVHLLSQIAWDGSQKLPIRLLQTLTDNLTADRPIDKISTAIAAWLKVIKYKQVHAEELVDPKADLLIDLVSQYETWSTENVAHFVQNSGVFNEQLKSSELFLQTLKAALQKL